MPAHEGRRHCGQFGSQGDQCGRADHSSRARRAQPGVVSKGPGPPLSLWCGHRRPLRVATTTKPAPKIKTRQLVNRLINHVLARVLCWYLLTPLPLVFALTLALGMTIAFRGRGES